MSTSWKIEDNKAILTYEPDTLVDKSIVGSIGPVSTAAVKKNGSIQFIIDLSDQPVPKPLQERPKDEVRDSQ